MLATQRSLASVQLHRITPAAIAESATPWREAALEGFRRRNASLDALFYDVGKVKEEEARQIAPWLAREGALLIVPPTGEGPLRLCPSIDDFASQGGENIRALAVAGVGSSALGAAAFARNVADAFSSSVAAVVSGYGLSDLIAEAAGGWFWFGALNRARHAFQWLDYATGGVLEAELARSAEATRALRGMSLDTRAVYALLSDERFRFRLLTGHSKGNLVISEALYELEDDDKGGKLSSDTWVVTISAAIAMPWRFRNIIDVIGDIDWFGAVNSRLGIDVELKPHMAWHHTNTELWWHLPVTQVFQDLIATRGISLNEGD
jgi:hypothetical protein